MFRTTLHPALALTALAVSALALGGCGSGDAEPAGSSAPAASAPAASAPASSAATPSATTESPAASPSASTAAAEVKDPCDVLNAGQVSKLTDVQVKKGTTSAVATSKLCTWLPKDGTKKDAAIFTAQEGPLPGPLTQVEGQLKSEFNGTVSKLTVAGADDARYITGKKSGLKVIDVLAQKDDVFYQVIVASPRDVSQHKAGAIKLAETLLSS